ncbi:MAG: 50S ribosomal protein L16 [Candidatus Micrarchaeota archaeon]
MGLRPARTSREVKGQPWTRVSRKRPRKSFVKGTPHNKVRQFMMGTDKPYEYQIELILQEPIQIRDNSIESARQACNKLLEKQLLSNYFFQITKYPHHVLRESASLGVAGADRISKGMKKCFGKPKGRLARCKIGEPIFRIRCMKKDLLLAKKAIKRGNMKLTGKMKIVTTDIAKEAWNASKKEVIFEKKEEETPVAVAKKEESEEKKEEALEKVEEKQEKSKK